MAVVVLLAFCLNLRLWLQILAIGSLALALALLHFVDFGLVPESFVKLSAIGVLIVLHQARRNQRIFSSAKRSKSA